MTERPLWCKPEDASNPYPCPKCGGPTDEGYGLAGGGFGSYVFCIKPECDYFKKEQEEDE